MIKLQRNSLTRLDAFQVETMSLQLSERQSTASFTVGPEAPEIGIGDWLQDETDPGAGIVWRVRTVDTSYEKGTRTVTLEHMINALKDRVMFGEITAAMMGGGNDCTARQAVDYVLDKCPQWTLGTMQASLGNTRNAYGFNGDDLLSAMSTISGTLEDPWWEYDFSVYPFRISIRKRSETVGAEMRLSRNISTAKMTIDRSRMYTRIYPIGENNLHISGNYLQKNTAEYGVIAKVQTDQSKTTEAALRAWAQELLDKHADPYVTMSVTAVDLSRETGEPLDRIRLGVKCRVPLPGYGTAVTETITKLSWSDKKKEPDKVSVTLANEVQDVASIVNRLTESSSATSGRGGRTRAKKDEKDNAWLDDQEDYIQLIAKKTFGTKDKSQVASLKVDGDGIHGTVTRTEGKVVKAESKIEQLEDEISLTVKKDGIISSINQTAEKIKISASKIQLDGQTLVNALKGYGINVLSVTSTIIRGTVATIGSSSSVAGDLKVYGKDVDWKSAAVVTSDNLTTNRSFAYSPNSTATNLAFVAGRIATGTTTIYYLGR